MQYDLVHENILTSFDILKMSMTSDMKYVLSNKQIDAYSKASRLVDSIFGEIIYGKGIKNLIKDVFANRNGIMVCNQSFDKDELLIDYKINRMKIGDNKIDQKHIIMVERDNSLQDELKNYAIEHNIIDESKIKVELVNESISVNIIDSEEVEKKNKFAMINSMLNGEEYKNSVFGKDDVSNKYSKHLLDHMKTFDDCESFDVDIHASNSNILKIEKYDKNFIKLNPWVVESKVESEKRLQKYYKLIRDDNNIWSSLLKSKNTDLLLRSERLFSLNNYMLIKRLMFTKKKKLINNSISAINFNWSYKYNFTQQGLRILWYRLNAFEQAYLSNHPSISRQMKSGKLVKCIFGNSDDDDVNSNKLMSDDYKLSILNYYVDFCMLNGCEMISVDLIRNDLDSKVLFDEYLKSQKDIKIHADGFIFKNIKSKKKGVDFPCDPKKNRIKSTVDFENQDIFGYELNILAENMEDVGFCSVIKNLDRDLYDRIRSSYDNSNIKNRVEDVFSGRHIMKCYSVENCDNSTKKHFKKTVYSLLDRCYKLDIKDGDINDALYLNLEALYCPEISIFINLSFVPAWADTNEGYLSLRIGKTIQGISLTPNVELKTALTNPTIDEINIIMGNANMVGIRKAYFARLFKQLTDDSVYSDAVTGLIIYLNFLVIVDLMAVTQTPGSYWVPKPLRALGEWWNLEGEHTGVQPVVLCRMINVKDFIGYMAGDFAYTAGWEPDKFDSEVAVVFINGTKDITPQLLRCMIRAKMNYPFEKVYHDGDIFATGNDVDTTYDGRFISFANCIAISGPKTKVLLVILENINTVVISIGTTGFIVPVDLTVNNLVAPGIGLDIHVAIDTARDTPESWELAWKWWVTNKATKESYSTVLSVIEMACIRFEAQRMRWDSSTGAHIRKTSGYWAGFANVVETSWTVSGSKWQDLTPARNPMCLETSSGFVGLELTTIRKKDTVHFVVGQTSHLQEFAMMMGILKGGNGVKQQTTMSCFISSVKNSILRRFVHDELCSVRDITWKSKIWDWNTDEVKITMNNIISIVSTLFNSHVMVTQVLEALDMEYFYLAWLTNYRGRYIEVNSNLYAPELITTKVRFLSSGDLAFVDMAPTFFIDERNDLKLTDKDRLVVASTSAGNKTMFQDENIGDRVVSSVLAMQPYDLNLANGPYLWQDGIYAKNHLNANVYYIVGNHESPFIMYDRYKNMLARYGNIITTSSLLVPGNFYVWCRPDNVVTNDIINNDNTWFFVWTDNNRQDTIIRKVGSISYEEGKVLWNLKTMNLGVVIRNNMNAGRFKKVQTMSISKDLGFMISNKFTK